MARTITLRISDPDWERLLEEHADLLSWAEANCERLGLPAVLLGRPESTAEALLSEALLRAESLRHGRVQLERVA